MYYIVLSKTQISPHIHASNLSLICSADIYVMEAILETYTGLSKNDSPLPRRSQISYGTCEMLPALCAKLGF